VIEAEETTIAVDPGFSLAETCAPVAWARGRWPNEDWIDGALLWVGRDDGAVVTRRVRQTKPGLLAIFGERDSARDAAWARRVLAVDRRPPALSDPIVAAIAAAYPGMRPFSSGSLFDGIVGCIAGQSITVAAAAVTEARIAGMFHEGIEFGGRRFWPKPLPDQLAAAEPARVRESGVTWKRAEAIVAASRAWLNGELPNDDEAMLDPDGARAALRRLPLVGAWTAESALLWGIGHGDAFPPNDVALLRAARQAFGQPEMTHRELERLADGWRPGRAWASRWLWTALLGAAPDRTKSR
jgi:3-methyladenine DNA glycosylase/8-oxoguanine DNA glycosylase